MIESANATDSGWRRVNPLTIVAQVIRTAVSAIIPAAAIIYGAANNSENGVQVAAFAIPGFALLFAAVAGIAWLRWIRLRYRIGESDVRVEQGLIGRSARSVPFERIQDVSLEQKLIPRLLGLVEVKFESGAGGKEELHLAFVAEAEGERLRETVRALAEGAEVVAIGVPPAPDARKPLERGETLFAMGPGRLLKFGLFEFSLIAFAALAGAAQQLDFLLPFDIWDIDLWEERLAGPGTWLAGLGTLARVVGVLVAIATFVVVGFATGIGRTVLRDYGFRLERTAKGFRRRRGLLAKTDVVMPVHRVQALSVKTGILRRLFGWHGLSFISLAQDSGSSNHDAAPFAQIEEIAPIAGAAGFDLPGDDTDWRRPSPYYHTDRAILAAALPALGGLGAVIFAPSLWLGLGLFALAGILVVREHLLWRFERHALDSRQVLSRRGWLAPALRIASRVKLHSAEIRQGPIARRRGYADLKFGLAGGSLAFRGIPLDQARAMRGAVLESIAAIDFARLPR